MVLGGVVIPFGPVVAWVALPDDAVAWAGGDLDEPAAAIVASCGGDPCARTVLPAMVMVAEAGDRVCVDVVGRGDPSRLLAGEGVALSSAVRSSVGVPHMSTDSSVVVYATLVGVRPGVGPLDSRLALALRNFSLACSFSRTSFGVRFSLCILVAMYRRDYYRSFWFHSI